VKPRTFARSGAALIVLLVVVLAQSQSAGEKPHIRGQITNTERGVEAVKVRLESYDGESCAKLAEYTSSLSAEQETMLKKCKTEVGICPQIQNAVSATSAIIW
jgi:hypothetical protein